MELLCEFCRPLKYKEVVETVCLTCFHDVFLCSYFYEHNYHCSHYYALMFFCSRVIRIVCLLFDRFYASVIYLSEQYKISKKLY